MFGNKSKRSLRALAKHLLFGIPINIAAGPLGFRAELDVDPKDEQNPCPSRIVFHQEDSEDQGPLMPGASAPVLDIDTGNRHTRENIDQTRQEGGPGVIARDPEQGRRNTILGSPVSLYDIVADAESGFGPLRTLLGTISAAGADRQGTIAVRNKIEVLLPRITSLDPLFATSPSDAEDRRSRNGLIREVKGIERELQLLCEKPGLQQDVDHDQHDEVMLRLLEDLQEIILHYQMLQSTVICGHGLKPMDQAEAAVLNNLRYAQQTEYRHGDRNGCLKGTRSAVLDKIELWTHDLYKPPVYWLNGLAGTGKTTIAQTIAERMFADGRLGASFFCSRDFEDRSNLKLIFPTLAVQLARNYAEFRAIFVPLVQSDPEIAHESLYGQMNKLIFQPLVKSAISTVIVIDALDECEDDEPASAILSVLGQFVTKISNVKFFVTGRPEPGIREGFRLPLLAKETDVFVLHDVEPIQVNRDIRLFFSHKFSQLRQRGRAPDDWPTEEELNLLCERAAGFFVYAIATTRFIDQKTKDPEAQLDRLLQSVKSEIEGRTEFRTKTTLDSLYMSILQEAFGDPEDDSNARSVLGTVVLAINPLSPSTIAALLGFDSRGVFPLLLSAHSLLVLQEVDHPVRPFHKSFPDFITDLTRCTNPRFHVCPSDQHAKLLVGCLELMNQRLEQNMCKLPDGVINSDVSDLKERAKQYVDDALEYTCRSWHKHLIGKMPAQALEILDKFLTEKFLFWLEVLSVIGAVREAIDALETTAKWLDDSPTLHLVKDYSRFVITFFDLINTSAPHIYISALPLSPQTSMVRKTYEQYELPLARVVHGFPTSWEPVVATAYDKDPCGAVAWSSCNKFIAVAKPGAVEIRDAVTLYPVSTFKSPDSMALQLVFSPDNRLLTQFNDKNLITWDVQTGGSVDTIFPEVLGVDRLDFSSTSSTDGKMVAAVYLDQNLTRILATHDLSTTRTHLYPVPEDHIISPIWAHGEFLRFATVKPGLITTCQVEFTFTHPPEVVERLVVPEEITDEDTYREFLFLSTRSRLASHCDATLVIWDAQASKFLLNISPIHTNTMTFSPDGRLFACTSKDTGDVCVWKETLAGYNLHQHLALPTSYATPLLSPNGESLVVYVDSTTNLWHTKAPILSRDPTPSRGQGKFILGFSPSKALAAFTRNGEDKVTIVDLQSGGLHSTIDTDVKVMCLGMAGSTIVVAGQEKIVTLNLAVENTKENPNNGVRITTFNPPQFEFLDMSISPGLSHIVALRIGEGHLLNLEMYDVSTGKRLASVKGVLNSLYTPEGFKVTDTPSEDGDLSGDELWFTPDGREIWDLGYRYSSVNRWEITQCSEPDPINLRHLENTACPPGVHPSRSSHGYEVTDDGWILSPTKKRLLWLPHHWRSHQRWRRWAGRFLGLSHRELPEIVILEFLD